MGKDIAAFVLLEGCTSIITIQKELQPVFGIGNFRKIPRVKQPLEIELLVSTLPLGLKDTCNSVRSQQVRSLKIQTFFQVFLLECIIHPDVPA